MIIIIKNKKVDWTLFMILESICATFSIKFAHNSFYQYGLFLIIFTLIVILPASLVNK